MKEDFVSEFSTPMMSVTRVFPTTEGLHPISPVMFFGFNQTVDQEDFLKNLTFYTSGKSKPYSTAKIAQALDIAEDTTAKRLSTQFLDGYWIAVVSTKPFPSSTTVTMKLGKLKSKEGPLASTQEPAFTFHTVGSLTAKCTCISISINFVLVSSYGNPISVSNIHIVFNQSIAVDDDIDNLVLFSFGLLINLPSHGDQKSLLQKLGHGI
jgi:hypothetical protein